MQGGTDHECSVCLAPFVDPIDLACGHTFCRYCLIKSTRLAPDGRSCPLCRSLISIRSVMEHPVSEARVLGVRKLLGDEVYDERLALRARMQGMKAREIEARLVASDPLLGA